jgi:hypothetical protein
MALLDMHGDRSPGAMHIEDPRQLTLCRFGGPPSSDWLSSLERGRVAVSLKRHTMRISFASQAKLNLAVSHCPGDSWNHPRRFRSLLSGAPVKSHPHLA